MMRIYNKDLKLLHLVVRADDCLESQRTDLIDSDECLQCSKLYMKKGVTFKPHQHIWKRGPEDIIAQESWVVIKGKVACKYYDTDGTYITAVILEPGDASFTLYGGHTYEILKDGTIVYEFKNGPYTGQENDKVFI